MTTTINSIEQMEGLGNGSVITVGEDSIWRLEADGWNKGDYTLASKHFVGEVKQGRVALGVKTRPGQVWDASTLYGGYTYIVVAQVNQSEDWWVVRCRGASFSALQQVSRIPGEYVGGSTEEWQQLAYSMGSSLAATRDEKDLYLKSYERVKEQAAESSGKHAAEMAVLREKVETGIHAHLADCDSEELRTMLRECGMRQPDEVVEVGVETTCTRYVSVPVDAMQSVVGDYEITSAGATYVGFKVPLTTRVTVEGGQCGCPAVRRRQVRGLLTEASVAFDDFSYTVNCANCANVLS